MTPVALVNVFKRAKSLDVRLAITDRLADMKIPFDTDITGIGHILQTVLYGYGHALQQLVRKKGDICLPEQSKVLGLRLVDVDDQRIMSVLPSSPIHVVGERELVRLSSNDQGVVAPTETLITLARRFIERRLKKVAAKIDIEMRQARQMSICWRYVLNDCSRGSCQDGHWTHQECNYELFARHVNCHLYTIATIALQRHGMTRDERRTMQRYYH
jgi:hypothetical protein